MEDASSRARKKEIRDRFVEETLCAFPIIQSCPLSNELLSTIKRSGLIITGGRGQGKSNLAKVIASQIIRSNPDIQVKITDSTQSWSHGFEPIEFQYINEDTLVGDIYFGERNFLYDIELVGVDDILDTITSICMSDFGLQRLFKKEDLMEDSWILYVIEEAQNVIGSYALNGKSGKGFLKLISESRNFNMNLILITQRLSDVSTKAVERCSTYAFSKMTGDNDLKKVQRICGKESGVAETLPKLGVGEFILWNGDHASKLNVPLYNPVTKPMLWCK